MLFLSWWMWRLPPATTAAYFRELKNKWLITDYDIGVKLGVISCYNFQLSTEATQCYFLLLLQQSWYKLCSTAPHLQNVWQDVLDGSTWYSYDRTNIMDCLPMICNNCILHYDDVFWCYACQWLSWTLIIVNRFSSILKAFSHKKFYFNS